jgi:hypothetical protein
MFEAIWPCRCGQPASIQLPPMRRVVPATPIRSWAERCARSRAGEIRVHDHDIVVRQDDDVAGCAADAAVVALAERARVVDADDLVRDAGQQRAIVRADGVEFLRPDAADHERHAAPVIRIQREADAPLFLASGPRVPRATAPRACA